MRAGEMPALSSQLTMKRPWVLIVVALLCVLLPLRGVLASGMMAHDSMQPAAQGSVAQQGIAPPCHTAAMDDMASTHGMADASGAASHDDATPHDASPHGEADKDCAAKCCLCSATCTAAALPALDRVTPHLPARFTFALLPAPRFHSAPLALPVEPPIARA